MLRRFVETFLRKYTYSALRISFLTIGATALALVNPWIIRMLIDNVMLKANLRLLWVMILMYFSAAALRFWCEYKKEVASYTTVETLIADVREALVSHAQKLSLIELDKQTIGEIFSRVMNDTRSLKEVLLLTIADMLSSIVILIGIACILFVINMQLALISLCVFPIFIIYYQKKMKHVASVGRAVRDAEGRLSSTVGESFQAARIIKGNSLFDFEQKRFKERLNAYIECANESHILRSSIWILCEFVSVLSLGLLIGVGAWNVIEGTVSVGQLVSMYVYLGMAFEPLIRIMGYHNYVHEAIGSLERMYEIYDIEEDPAQKNGTIQVRKLEGNIEFQHVKFGYRPEKEIIKDVSFTIRKGEAVALVGPSGVGKSTLCSLILRFYNPQAGVIRLDGNDIQTLDCHSYRSRIGLVLQNDFHFFGTIYENITYGIKNASLSDVIEAAKKARVHDYIESLPMSYQTLIGERGYQLSGGERQRISIARMLLRNPDILIWDEATSAIDSETEEDMCKEIFNSLRGKTKIVIAHRFSTLKHADRIIVMDEGKVIAAGNHDELWEKSERYRTIVGNQLSHAGIK